jgi:arylsulfatase A-like enzyme
MTNIALVVLDTLRKDSFDEHFDWLPGTRFENAWSTSHWTVPAHASLFTGKYASEVGVTAASKSFDCEDPSIAELLHENGYTTRAFSCNVNISRNWQFDRGFEQFEGNWRVRSVQGDVFNWDVFISSTRDMGPKRFPLALWCVLTKDCDTWKSMKRGWLLKKRDIGFGEEARDDGASEVLEYVRSTDFGTDEFLFLNLMEAHAPYNPPEEYASFEEAPHVNGLRAKIGGEGQDADMKARIRQAYDDSCAYLSDIYREIFVHLQEDFDAIITVGDHGEMLGEHGVYEHMYGLYPELTHVPLSIWTGGEERESRDETVSVLDVHRTIGDLADIELESRGRNILDDPRSNTFLTEYHTITEVNFNSVKNAGYSDIEFLKDPLSGIVDGEYYGHETFKEGFLEHGKHEDPITLMEELMNDLDRRDVERNTEDLDETVMNQLKDLGYA